MLVQVPLPAMPGIEVVGGRRGAISFHSKSATGRAAVRTTTKLN
jgi:hypothetical protein